MTEVLDRIAVLGISGRVGSRIADELVRRGHRATGIARDVARVEPRDGVTVKAGDAGDPDALVPLLRGHGVVVSAMRFDGGLEATTLLALVEAAKVPRLIVVGGAGSLEAAPGVALVDMPDFPAAYKAEALAGRAFLAGLRGASMDWTFLSPSAVFEPGTRTGRYRTGDDRLLVDASGASRISMEDYAIALVDELEAPKRSRARFTVGY